jgi:hypothetical protein
MAYSYPGSHDGWRCRRNDAPSKGALQGTSGRIASTFGLPDTHPGLPMHLRLRRSAGLKRRTRGQSLAEFALVFPILMLLVGGIIQFGVIFWGQNTLNQVVRDAGRYAVTETDCQPANRTDVVNKINQLGSSMGVATLTNTTVVMPTNGEMVGGTPDPQSDRLVGPPPGVVTIMPNFCPATTNTDHVWLRITVEAKVPIFFPFVPGSGAIASTALFRMEPHP